MTYRPEHISESEIGAYIDGEIGEHRRREVAGHITECARCRRRLETQILGQAAISSAPPIQSPPVDFQSVAPGLPERGSARRTFIATSVLASLVIVVSVVFGYYLTESPASDRSVRTAGIDLGLYLSQLDHPASPPRFEASYRLRPADLEDAIQEVGIRDRRPLQRIPDEYEVADVRIIHSGREAAAVQVVYDGPHGGLDVFCLADRRIPEFSGFQARLIELGEKTCTSVLCSNYRAFAFSTSDHSYAIVGRRSAPGLDTLVYGLIP